MLLGYSTWGMPHVPILDAIEQCARIGYDSLEMTVTAGWSAHAADLDAGDRRRIREQYDRCGIQLSGLIGNTPVLTTDDAEWQRSLRLMEGYLDLAAELQGEGERLPVSCISYGPAGSWERDRDLAAERYARFAAMAAERGVVLAAEPHAMFALRTPADTLWLLEQVNSPALAVALDISHFNVQGMDMDEVVAQLAPHTVCSHVKDERGSYPAFDFLIPGEGTMDYPRYLRAMESAGYTGTIAVEVSLFVQRRPGYDALSAARRSYEVVAAAYDEAGIARPQKRAPVPTTKES